MPDSAADRRFLARRRRHYAAPEDDQQLDAFLHRPGRRDAHLRPSIELQRTWPWAQAVDLDKRGALASEIRNAVAGLLGALDEQLPLACNQGDRHQRPASVR